MIITTISTTEQQPTHAIQKAITDSATFVPTQLWVPESVTVNGQTVTVTWLGWYSREAFDAGAQPASAGVYPRPTTQISSLPPKGASLGQWVCEQAIETGGSTNPMNLTAPNQFAGGEVVDLV